MVETFGTETVDPLDDRHGGRRGVRPAPGGHHPRPRPAPARSTGRPRPTATSAAPSKEFTWEDASNRLDDVKSAALDRHLRSIRHGADRPRSCRTSPASTRQFDYLGARADGRRRPGRHARAHRAARPARRRLGGRPTAWRRRRRGAAADRQGHGLGPAAGAHRRWPGGRPGAGPGALPSLLRTASPPRPSAACRRPATRRPAGRALAAAALPVGRDRPADCRPRPTRFAGRAGRRRRGDALVLAPSVSDGGLRGAPRLRRAGVRRRCACRGTGPGPPRAAAWCVGARAAAWAPVPALAAVVVLDEHDEVYQEERAPTWNAWDVAAERAARAGVPVRAGHALPDARAAGLGRAACVPSRADERAAGRVVDVVDRRKEDPALGPVRSTRLVDARARRRPGRLRPQPQGPGHAAGVRACGELARCERCDAAVEHGRRRRRPGVSPVRQRSGPVVCLACGASGSRLLRSAWPACARGAGGAGGRAGGRGDGRDRRRARRRACSVGTEAVLHRVRAGRRGRLPRLDQELLAPRYRAGEQALALLARAARLVGGRGTAAGSWCRPGCRATRCSTPPCTPTRAGWPPSSGARRAALRFPPATALAAVSGEAAAAFVDGRRPGRRRAARARRAAAGCSAPPTTAPWRRPGRHAPPAGPPPHRGRPAPRLTVASARAARARRPPVA